MRRFLLTVGIAAAVFIAGAMVPARDGEHRIEAPIAVPANANVV
jgi:hypothetical protein